MIICGFFTLLENMLTWASSLSYMETNIRLLQSSAAAKLSHVRGITEHTRPYVPGHAQRASLAMLFQSLNPPTDYKGIYRLLSYMNKDEGSEVTHCCQVLVNFSAGVMKFIRHIFCINVVIINFVMHKLRKI
jgi:hypothetical protein